MSALAVAPVIQTPYHKNDPVLDIQPGDTIATELSGPFAVFVTPALAEYFLTLNEVNRSVKTKYVAMARDMVAGRWAYPSASIVFNDEGKLKNGQNRLNGTLLAHSMDRSYRGDWMRVEFGWDNGSLDVMDTGSPRSAADTLKLHGVGNQNVFSGMLNLVHKYEATVGTSRSWTNAAQGNYNASASEILAAYEDDETAIRHAVAVGSRIQRRLDKSLTAATWAAAYYICTKRSPGLADLFFAQVASEPSDVRSDAAQLLRDWEMRRRVKDKRSGDMREHIENIVRAFISHTKGEKPNFVRDAGFVLSKPPTVF